MGNKRKLKNCKLLLQLRFSSLDFIRTYSKFKFKIASQTEHSYTRNSDEIQLKRH